MHNLPGGLQSRFLYMGQGRRDTHVHVYESDSHVLPRGQCFRIVVYDITKEETFQKGHRARCRLFQGHDVYAAENGLLFIEASALAKDMSEVLQQLLRSFPEQTGIPLLFVNMNA